MKIVGNKEDVNVITLIHKSKIFKLRCYPKLLPYMDRNLEEDRGAEIFFDDLREVDSLIDILERFKKEICEYMGEWR